jgi:hypothetical protein
VQDSRRRGGDTKIKAAEDGEGDATPDLLLKHLDAILATCKKR